LCLKVKHHEPERVPLITAESFEKLELNAFNLKLAMKFYGVHHEEIVLKQAILETGNFKSRLCVQDHNLFGLYNSKQGRMFSFKHWSYSVKAYKTMIQYKYKEGEDYYYFLKRIGYAEDPDYIVKLKKLKV
jgi:flagellum-specific peptidoglycan hydrolase FlgJ